MSAVFIQGIGFVAVLFFVVSYQLRSNRMLFLCQLLGCSIFCLQFCLMVAYTGAVSLLVNILRNLLLLKIDQWDWVKSKVTMSGILLLLAVMTILTWDGWISLLPLASVGVTTVGYWTNNAQKLRLSQFFGSPCTLLYDILIHSWGGVISESITLASIIISVFRFGWSDLEKQTA